MGTTSISAMRQLTKMDKAVIAGVTTTGLAVVALSSFASAHKMEPSTYS